MASSPTAMPLASLATGHAVPRNEVARNRSQPGKVTGRLKVALDAMVWQGMTRRQAADHAKMSEHSLYVALGKAHIRTWYLAQIEVLRTSERSRNIHRLCEIRDAALNMPAVNAIKVLEQISDTPQSTNSHASSPGLVVIIEAPGTTIRTIEASHVLPNANATPDE